MIIGSAEIVVKRMTESTNSLHIDNKPLRERVLDVLRDAIVSGEFKPGQSLVEMDIAAQLGISRAPLREALQILSHEGLVEVTPYRGTVVRTLTRTDIEELYSLRCVLETFALRRVIARNNPQDVALLRARFEDMLAAAQAGDLKQVNNIDRQFHDTLIELSHHSLLATTWNAVSQRVRQVMALRNRQNTDITQIAYNHLPIIDAIAHGDEASGIELLQTHISSSGDLVAELWDDTPEEDGTA
jgi:DNA-binding GntR family transcriptional regulator